MNTSVTIRQAICDSSLWTCSPSKVMTHKRLIRNIDGLHTTSLLTTTTISNVSTKIMSLKIIDWKSLIDKSFVIKLRLWKSFFLMLNLRSSDHFRRSLALSVSQQISP